MAGGRAAHVGEEGHDLAVEGRGAAAAARGVGDAAGGLELGGERAGGGHVAVIGIATIEEIDGAVEDELGGAARTGERGPGRARPDDGGANGREIDGRVELVAGRQRERPIGDGQGEEGRGAGAQLTCRQVDAAGSGDGAR